MYIYGAARLKYTYKPVSRFSLLLLKLLTSLQWWSWRPGWPKVGNVPRAGKQKIWRIQWIWLLILSLCCVLRRLHKQGALLMWNNHHMMTIHTKDRCCFMWSDNTVTTKSIICDVMSDGDKTWVTLNRVPNQKDTMTSLLIWAQT